MENAIKSPNMKRSLQNYKVSNCKLIHKHLALNCYPQDLIGPANLFDIFAAN